jgi:hypothetical protein
VRVVDQHDFAVEKAVAEHAVELAAVAGGERGHVERQRVDGGEAAAAYRETVEGCAVDLGGFRVALTRRLPIRSAVDLEAQRVAASRVDGGGIDAGVEEHVERLAMYRDVEPDGVAREIEWGAQRCGEGRARQERDQQGGEEFAHGASLPGTRPIR